jgi:hypothetical protein
LVRPTPLYPQKFKYLLAATAPGCHRWSLDKETVSARGKALRPFKVGRPGGGPDMVLRKVVECGQIRIVLRPFDGTVS